MILLLTVLAPARETVAEPIKKIVYYGWSIPDTAHVRRDWKAIEELPFDGIGISVALDRDAWRRGNRSTDNTLGWQVFGRRRFDVEEFADAIDDLRAPRWQTSRHDFLPVAVCGSSASDIHWLDAERWRVVENNWKVLVTIAAQAGTRGVLLDPEQYECDLFQPAAQERSTGRPLAELSRVARDRGRRLMRTAQSRLPGLVILWLYGQTLALEQPSDYGLLAPFFDGFLDEAGADARIVDGFEFSYGFEDPEQSARGRERVREAGERLSAVPDRYRKHVQAGFGLWLDYQRKLEHFSPDAFGRCVCWALEAADEYVWIYSERVGMFPPGPAAVPYVNAVRSIRQTPRCGAVARGGSHRGNGR